MTQIGLQRHIVRLMDHQAEWASLFEAETARLRDLIGDYLLDVQHVGSTAIPGLRAKPILDIAAAIRSQGDIPAIVAVLASNGYLDRGDGGRDGGYLLVRESEPDVRMVHLHLVETTDRQWAGYLAFRDILRADPVLRGQYAALKETLAAEFPADRAAYTQGKHAFITQVLRWHLHQE